jgi:metallo-beta-lactamase family protein
MLPRPGPLFEERLMHIQFLGAARTVTGSMHLITVNGTRILLECGLFQGRRAESFERNRNLPFDVNQIDMLVLSHAHIDHSGNIPSLVKNGFKGNIFSTPATRDLCSIMLRDSGHIQEQDAAYLNKKRRRSGEPPIEPLYTQEDAARSISHFISITYDRPFPIAPGVTLTYYDAGHILGSAMVCLDIQEGGGQRRLLFTGDLGRPDTPILRDPVIPRGVNILITESTYGDRLHGPQGENRERLRAVVNRAYKRGGKVIIPAFSVGRTQNIIYALHQLLERNEIPRLPVFVDSPLSVSATEVFLLHPECYDQETRQFLLDTDSRNPFSFPGIRYVREVEESKKINTLPGPAIIISASGMCESGRILHHLKNNIENPRNTVAIVGWQAPYTLGRRLVEKQERVKIFGEEYVRRADIEIINGFSAHADRNELLDWFRQVQNPDLEHVFVVHGEGQAPLALAEAILERGVPHVLVPEPRHVAEL